MASIRSRRSLRTPPRATRAKPAFSYAESEYDVEIDVEDEDTIINHQQTQFRSLNPSKPPTPPKKRHRPTKPDSDDSLGPATRLKKPKHPKLSTPKSTSYGSRLSSSFNIQTSGVIPPWQSLPYHILVQIFQYATYPLYDDHSFQPLPSGSWLLKIARLCRDFAEPAFTVLYATPPLVPMDKAHNLVELLRADPKALAFKYRQKVVSLQIDVDQVAAYSLPGSGHLDLHGLIKNLPRLVDLEFYHQKDLSPYRDLDIKIRWHYPDNLFDALEYVDPEADSQQGDKTTFCKLGSWRWSSRLARKLYPIEKLREIHLKPSFSTLRKIAFVNYQVPYVRPTEDDPKHEKILADSLSVLKNLEHLILESSTLVNATLLPLLPKNLRNLELINCWNVKAEELAEFLLTHGSQFRCLTLNHNQSLSLSFLPVLGTACPKLQVFRMNLAYFQLHSTYRDSDPLYEHLLLPGQVPAWPSTLQTIELIQLRQWQNEAAEMFFQSLLDSAADLPDLRRLTIQVILNIDWRTRAKFRDKWVGSMDRVFKRVSPPPEKHFTIRREAVMRKHISLRSNSGTISIAALPSAPSTAEEEVQKPRQVKALKAKEATSPPSRRSTRTSARQIRTGTYAETPDNSDAEEPSGRENARTNRTARELASLRQAAGRDLLPSSPPQTPFEDEDSDDALLNRNNRKGKATEVIQGMCEVVDVRIDNLRPRETQVTAVDFVDEEVPGDSEWDGNDEFDGSYAW